MAHKRVLLVSLIALTGLALGVGSLTNLAHAESQSPTTTQKVEDINAESGSLEESSPNITVTIAGTTIPDGGTTTVANNPTLNLRVVDEGPIGTIIVRIDGKSYRQYDTQSTNFSKSLSLDLSQGSHEIKIIRPTNQTTTTHISTVVADISKPRMAFTSPFSTNGKYAKPNDNYTVDTSRVQLSGTLHDISDITEVVVENRYTYESIGGSDGFRDRFVIDDPGESFSQTIQLGPKQTESGNGTNALTVKLTDTMGQVRIYEVDLFVEDTNAPNIEITDQTTLTDSPTVRLRARVNDSVGLKSIGTRFGSANESSTDYVIFSQDADNRPLERAFTKEVSVSSGSKTLTIVASDGVHSTTENVTVSYRDIVSPTIQLDEQLLRSEEGKNLRAKGSVADGQVTQVTMETVTADGEVIEFFDIYDGEVTSSVKIDEPLQTEVYPAEVQIRAIDSGSREHIQKISIPSPEEIRREKKRAKLKKINEEIKSENEDIGENASKLQSDLEKIQKDQENISEQLNETDKPEKEEEEKDSGLLNFIGPGFSVGGALIALASIALVAIRRRR